jgi:hypothetical protein
MVNPPRLPEWALPAGERLEKAWQAAIQRAAQEIGTPSGEGQDAGGDLRSKDGKGYQAPDGSVETQRMVRAFLAVNAAFAG